MDGKASKHPVFNGEYHVLQSLGEGNTSKVYLARHISDPKRVVALKLLREEFLQRDKDSIRSVEQEIQILQGLKHQNIIQILGYGSDGRVVKPSGREIGNLVYILLEMVSGGLLFDLCQTLGGMGENGGRYFLSQMCDVLEYMHGKGVVHRDLKLENILVDENMNLKVADFGFATFRKIHNLKSYRGTMTYMAPEIKEGKTYDGQQIDMFSTGVILFIIVQGIFPFKEAKKDEYFYNLLLKKDYATYWKKTGGQNLSEEFKDLILRMFSYEGKDRPTVQEIRAHPWMQAKCDMKQIRHDILSELAEKRTQSTADSERIAGSSRGPEKLHLIRETGFGEQAFDDIMAYDIILDQIKPGTIWDDIEEYIENNGLTEKWALTEDEDAVDDIMDDDEQQDKPKHFTITIKPDEIDGAEERDEVKGFDKETVVEIKFFRKDDQTARVHIQAVKGDVAHWKQTFTNEEGLK